MNLLRLPIEIRSDWQAINVRWFNTSQFSIFGAVSLQYTIGAVLTRTPHGTRAFLGVCFGHDQADDIRSIAQTGCELDVETAKLFFPETEYRDDVGEDKSL